MTLTGDVRGGGDESVQGRRVTLWHLHLHLTHGGCECECGVEWNGVDFAKVRWGTGQGRQVCDVIGTEEVCEGMGVGMGVGIVYPTVHWAEQGQGRAGGRSVSLFSCDVFS